MVDISMELPDEVVDIILSYGDVIVTQRYCGVIRQLNYYMSEFDWQHNHNSRSIWYLRPPNYYPCYALMKNNMKRHLNIWIKDFPRNFSYVMRFKGTREGEQLVQDRRYEHYMNFISNTVDPLALIPD